MKVRIDSAGRVVLPKAIRDELGFRSGEELELRRTAHGVELSSTSQHSRLQRIGNVLIFVVAEGQPEVDATEVLRQERESRRDWFTHSV